MIFYKETNFKETPIGEIPKDWEAVRLGDEEVSEELFYGLTARAVNRDTGLKMLRTTEIKEYSVDWKKLPFCEITEMRNNLGKYILKKGDLIAARAGTVGVSILVDMDFDNIIFGSYLIKVKLKPTVDPKFVHYFFQSSIYWKHLQKAQGSTLKNINLPLLKSLKIPLPPLSEQCRIAEILSTVDHAIQKTNKIIAKTERLKKCLMQELLTKGIGHKEFKDTEIGRIPKEWEVVRLGRIGEFQYGITTSGVREDTGIRLLRITDITDEGINWKRVPFCKITEEEFRKYQLNLGDVLFARIGATTGKTCYISKPIRGVFGSYLIKFKLTHGLDTQFLYFYTQSSIYWSQVNRMKEGQLKKGLNTKMLGSLLMPLPIPFEQQKIAEILLTIEKKLELERKEKSKLERIKQGMMDLLLTGKIRVKAD